MECPFSAAGFEIVEHSLSSRCLNVAGKRDDEVVFVLLIVPVAARVRIKPVELGVELRTKC